MNAAPTRIPAPHLDALTGIRGLAAWFVVLFHLRRSMVDIAPPAALDAFGKGYLAVDLFFMLSGFVLWLNYGRRIGERGLGEAPQFWWRRFARIWPLHAAILAGLVVFALALLVIGRDSANYPFAELPLHALLIQNWGFTDALRWNHPAWSISTEMAAYLAFPFLVLALPWARLRPLALLGVAAGLCVMLHLAFTLGNQSSLGGSIPTLGLPRCLAEFTLGMALCRLWQELNGTRRARQGAKLMAFLAAILALCAGVWSGMAETAFVPAALALLLLALALDDGPVARLLGSAPLRWLGDRSYATYLLHFPLFMLFKLVAVDASLQIGWAGLAAFLIVLLALSVLLYRFLERPAQRWLNAHPPALQRGFPAG